MTHNTFINKACTAIMGLVLAGSFSAFAQLPPIPLPMPAGQTTENATDTSKAVTAPRTAIRPYEKVITKEFTTKKGLFTVHQNKDKVYFEIPDSLLGRSIMVINRLTKVTALMEKFPGEELDQNTVYFEKGKDSSILIRVDLVVNEADKNSAIYKAVSNASINPTLVRMPIVAYGNNSAVVDASRLLKDKTLINSVNPQSELAAAANVAAVKDIMIESIKVFPINVEIKTSKTTTAKPGALPTGTPVDFETNTSFILLPEKPMMRRYFDSRVGYFADTYYPFSDDQHKVEIKRFIVRWRLEPKPEDMEKWKKGELVEPQKPIVIYIDPATPRQWRPFLIKGINDWQAAFEQAGFKNAIMGKEWPENDSTMSMEDARYSFINYLPSTTANAYGPNVHDPRSGEIIQTHIGWFHNVMSLLKNWYMIQASAIDPAARKPKFDDELMGNLIRFVSSHEVGHTLGLRHNFGSSSRTPVDSLRSNSYLTKYGHTASIMDYARFNYVAQPEDKITRENIFPRIGEYDKWAIEYGYKFLNGSSADDEFKVLVKETVKRNAANPRLWFGDGEGPDKFDPRCQTEDLSDDAAKASALGIKNLQRIMKQLPEWTFEENGVYKNLGEAYQQVMNQYTRYLGHVMKYVGGVEKEVKSEGNPMPVFKVTPKAKQLDCLNFFNEQVFNTPLWLSDMNVADMVYRPRFPDIVADMQERVLNTLIDGTQINKIIGNEMKYGTTALSATEYVGTIHKFIWKDLKSTGNIKIDAYRRNLQKHYIGALFEVLRTPDPLFTENDAVSILKSDLTNVKKEVTAALPKVTDQATALHLNDILDRIKRIMEGKI